MKTEIIPKDIAVEKDIIITQASARPHVKGMGWLALIFAACVIGVFAGVEGSHSIFIAFGLFLLIGLIVVRRQDGFATDLFLVVYSTGVIAAVVLYIIYMNRYGAPYYVGGSDDLNYELAAREVVYRLGILDYSSIRGGIVPPWHNSVGYVYLVSLLYRLGELFGGFHTMIPRLFNGMCLGILSIFSYQLALRLHCDRRTALYVGMFSGLLPIMVYNAAHTFRDIPISLLLLIGVYIWTPQLESSRLGPRMLRWAVTLLLVLLLSELRFYQSIVLLIVAFAGDVIAPNRLSSNKKMLYALSIVIAAITLLWILREDIAVYAQRLEDTHEEYTEYWADLSEGLSAYVFTAPLPLGYILRIGYALITPLPVASLEVERLWLSFGTIVQYFFLPFFGLGLLQSFKRPLMLPLLTAFLLLFSGMAFFTFISRHIVQALPYGVILAIMGYQQYRQYRTLVWALFGFVGVGLIVAYVLLKL
ncbi:MAG: hypothetical protein QXP01_04145 [Candidatus Hadarchaeum sp.]